MSAPTFCRGQRCAGRSRDSPRRSEQKRRAIGTNRMPGSHQPSSSNEKASIDNEARRYMTFVAALRRVLADSSAVPPVRLGEDGLDRHKHLLLPGDFVFVIAGDRVRSRTNRTQTVWWTMVELWWAVQVSRAFERSKMGRDRCHVRGWWLERQARSRVNRWRLLGHHEIPFVSFGSLVKGEAGDPFTALYT